MKLMLRYDFNCISLFLGRGIVWFITGLTAFTSCNKEENDGPVISFDTSAIYISTDTILKPGSAVPFKIHAENLQSDITNFQLRREYAGGMEILVDTGIHNSTFDYSRVLYKGVHPSEKWVFRVTDQEGMRAEVSFTLTNDPDAGYDSLLNYPTVIFGAQDCPDTGGFFDIDDHQMYFLDQAFLVQDSIHLLYYFDAAGDQNTVSSPGANIDSLIFPGPAGLTHWTLLNETRFFETALTPAEFDAVINDSLVIAAYDELNSKRKAKNLVAGEVYSFKTSTGRFGLFRVNGVSGQATGTVNLSIKMQP